ncbi:hypothetical protein V2J09_012793 [Rumex salicifolius]
MERGGEEKKVMIAVDESECSELALDWALSNLKPNLAGAGVILFTVIPLDYSAVVAGSVDIVPEMMTSIQDKQKKSAIRLLNKARNICANHGVEAECLYKFGNPKEAICDAVNKYPVRMLVLGSHHRGAFKRVFMGSVSSYCVHNAKCPVLVAGKPSSA